jgi:hypothetical protein
MAISLGLDALVKLLLEGNLRKRERIFEFLDLLVEQSEKLMNIWTEIGLAAGRVPEDRLTAQKAGEYFSTLDKYDGSQSGVAITHHALYDSISSATDGFFSETELAEICGRAANVIVARTQLRKLYNTMLGPSKMLPDQVLGARIAEDLNQLAIAVARFKATIAVLKAK